MVALIGEQMSNGIPDDEKRGRCVTGSFRVSVRRIRMWRAMVTLTRLWRCSPAAWTKIVPFRIPR